MSNPEMNSKNLFNRAMQVAPGGVHSPVRAFKSVGGTPVFFKSGQGAYLTSVEGDRYIDFCQSFGPLILGHADSEVRECVQKAVEDGWSYGACEPYSLALAEFIKARLPHVQKLRFVSSGTEAVMSALRVARAASGRQKILKFEGCYHGHVDSMLVKAGSGLAGTSASDSAGVSRSIADDTVVAPLDDEAALEAIFQKYGSELAAAIIEPLPCNYGLLVQRQEFLEKLRTLCTTYKALLIFDEVITGFRTGLGGMTESTQIKPDLVTFGKVLGGGFPVGCFAGRADLLDLVAPMGPVYQAGTLSANPVGMRAGLTTLEKVVREDVYKKLEERGARFQDKLQREFDRIEYPMQVVRRGSIFWMHGLRKQTIHRLDAIPANHAAEFRGLFHACLKNGVYLAPSGYEVGFLSYAHTDAILDEAIHKIIASAQESRSKGGNV